MNFVNGISGLSLAAYEKTSDARAVIKKGVLIIGKEVSYVAYDIYSMEGFEKWTKASVANLELISCIPAMKGIFGECLKTLKDQKDLYYATMIFTSLRHLVGKEEIKDANDQVIGTRRCFQFPRRDDDRPNSGYDWIKFWGVFANVCEVGKFIQKHKICSFERCSALASKYGAYEAFGYRLDRIPIVQRVFEAPKDVFIVMMSLIDLKRCYYEPGDYLIKTCKVVGSLGKIGLISSGFYYNKHIGFRVLCVVTQNASLFGYLIKAYQGRQARFEHPQPAATAA